MISKYDINNLWRYDLPKGWGLMYSVRRNEIIVISIILEWLHHKEYEKRFGTEERFLRVMGLVLRFTKVK